MPTVEFFNVASAIFAIVSPVFLYFYARKYKEDREFRKDMYKNNDDRKQEIGEIKVSLARNCTLTQEMHEDIRQMKDERALHPAH